ncbi:MAG: S-layer homology domain-containing protein [Oscillospiraceae bacterium]|nr:S-layer homology domain-containing protein [Oscillospiraceae bacterium]
MSRSKGIRFLSLLLAVIMVFAVLSAAALAADPCKAVLAGMTTEEKVSQLLMPAFRYYTDEDGKLKGLDEITPEVEAILQKRGFAGVILFAQNAGETEKTVRLIDAMQTANALVGRPQLLVAVDQEGGIVARLGQGTQTPGNMALGAVGDLAATRTAAAIIGQELKAIGFNLDFAPVVDVNNNPANPVIGVRSFSDDPETAAEQGVAFMKALQGTGTVSTLKHFPGHGDTATDSHTGLPCIDKSYDELKKTELVPFKACIEAGADAVMTAHIQYPQIEKETYISKETGETINLPATLSKTIITDILRGDMGFDGVIVTDALNMDAIEKHFDRLDAARLAIEAGVDILLMPVDTSSKEGIEDLDKYITDVAKLVDAGKISGEKVDAAVLRILHLKEEKGLLTPYESGDVEARVSKAVSSVGSAENHGKEWEITKRAITLVKNDNNVLPLNKAGQNIVVLTAYNNEVFGMEYAVNLLRDEGKLPEGTEVTVKSLQGMGLSDALPLIEGADHVIVVSEVSSASAPDPASAKGAYSTVVDGIIDQVHKNEKTVTVLSVYLPYDTARYQKADAIMIAWSAKAMSEDPRVTDGAVKQYGPNMPAALYLALSPDESPSGKLPVNIPALDGSYKYSEEILYPRGFGLTYKAAAFGDCRKDASCPISRFSDASPGAWYHDGVHWVLDKGLMNGVGVDLFAPEGVCSRAMAVTVLWRLAGEPEGKGAAFSDVAEGSWYYDAVSWAAGAGAVNGTGENTFSPDEPVTREMLAAILYRFAQSKGQGFKGAWAFRLDYSDVGDISDYAYEALCWMTMNDIMNGMGDGTLAPGAVANRAQMATILMRFCREMEL